MLDLKLLAYKQLLQEQRECSEFDNYDSEYLLEIFIKNNGYNPFEEAEKLWKEIETEYLNDELKKEFDNPKKCFSEEWLIVCKKMEKDFVNNKLAFKVLLEEYNLKSV